MLEIWDSQNGICAACKGSVKLFGTYQNRGNNAHFDHNHETGEARGFIHSRCNLMEGQLSKMTQEEFSNFIAWFHATR